MKIGTKLGCGCVELSWKAVFVPAAPNVIGTLKYCPPEHAAIDIGST